MPWALAEPARPPHESACRCRADTAHARQSRPDSGLGFQVKVVEIFEGVPSSRGSGGEKESKRAPNEGQVHWANCFGRPIPRKVSRCKATWKREFKPPWREAGPPNQHDDKVDSGQEVVNKEPSLSSTPEPKFR